MILKDIEKTVYRKRLNIVIVSFIASLLVLSLAYGQGLIALFADSVNMSVPAESVTVVADELATEAAAPDNNFKFNFFGVLMALLTCVFALHRLKTSQFFTEVYYVWQVKQQQNYIYRKLKKIKAAAKNDDVDALIILNFYYASLQQIYLLDDNTLTMSKLNKDIAELADQIQSKQLTISTEQYQQTMLTAY
jgi:hypothetical protein